MFEILSFSVPFSGLLEENLAEASPDVLRAMVKMFAQSLTGAESDALYGAEYRQVSEERTNSRKGYRARGWAALHPGLQQPGNLNASPPKEQADLQMSVETPSQ